MKRESNTKHEEERHSRQKESLTKFTSQLDTTCTGNWKPTKLISIHTYTQPLQYTSNYDVIYYIACSNTHGISRIHR